MLPYTASRGLNKYHWGYPKWNGKRFEIRGISPIIFQIAAQKFNFKDDYAPTGVVTSNFMIDFDPRHTYITQIENEAVKIPNVYFNVDNLNDDLIQMTHTFYDLKFELLVTPADAYTPYEKLMLPFDSTTWTLLGTTFAITFIMIFIINHLSRSTRTFVYGSKIKTPTLNVISIFFGISQTRLPTGSFSRFILIVFVFFCLIIRTCFQSKSFEFLTSEPRRPPPKSVEDLVRLNYTIKTINKEQFVHSLSDDLDKWCVLIGY
jgi:hypothetical protein